MDNEEENIPITTLNTDLSLEEIEDIIQQTIALLSGLDGSMVRPAYQEELPTRPYNDINWISCVLNVARVPNYHKPYWKQEEEYIKEIEEISVYLYIYGKDSYLIGANIRDGLTIDFNRRLLLQNGIVLNYTGELRAFGELNNGTWIKRCDLELLFTREINRKTNTNYISLGEIDLKYNK